MKAAIALLKTTLSEALFTNTTGFSGHGPPGAMCLTTYRVAVVVAVPMGHGTSVPLCLHTADTRRHINFNFLGSSYAATSNGCLARIPRSGSTTNTAMILCSKNVITFWTASENRPTRSKISTHLSSRCSPPHPLFVCFINFHGSRGILIAPAVVSSVR